MKRIYLDTSAYDHIHKRLGVTDSDLGALKSTIQEGKISALLSVLNIEEVLCAITADPTLAIRELWLVLDLGDWQRILKPPDMLLMDDITAYARGVGTPEPFIEDTHPVRAGLRTLLDPTQRDIDELLPILEPRISSSPRSCREYRLGAAGNGPQRLSWDNSIDGQSVYFPQTPRLLRPLCLLSM